MTDLLRTRSRHEDGFGMPGAELDSAGTATSLVEKGRTLGRGLDERRSLDAEVLAVVVDFTDAVGLGVDVALLIQNDGVLAPT